MESQGINQSTNRVVAFGEAMVRLTPPRNERLERTTQLDATVGGAELNTAVGLRCHGVPSAWVSRLPDTPLGRMIDRHARAAGVDTSGIQWVSEDDGRTGLYFLEEGVDPRPSAVTYDRADSAIARVTPGAFDWPALLDGAALFHICGITPAVSPGCRAETMAAVRAAKAAGVAVAFDLNYRSKLWSQEEARACFVELAPLATILFASRGDLRTFFDIDGDDEADVMRQAREQLGVDVVTMTRKRSEASRQIKLASVAMGPSGEVVQSDWRDTEIVDRLGGGDAYAAGFITGYLETPNDLTRAVALGSAASALKHTMPGDFLTATRPEIEAAASTTTSGVLQR